MSLRSHAIAAALPMTLAALCLYAWQSLLISKSVEATQLDIHLSRSETRACGAEKLRSLAGHPRVENDSLGGFSVTFLDEPKRSLRVFNVSEARTRIEATWRTSDDSPALRKEYETLSATVAEVLLQCESSRS